MIICSHKKAAKYQLIWASTPVAKSKSGVWWKKSLGEACSHGLEIFLVDGSHVRNAYSSDFDQGSNGFAYRFVPKGEIWIDDATPEEEWPFVAFHECNEVELMRGGMSYDKAHDHVRRIEDKLRREQHPGERR
jgi:hypothetical protein